VLAAAAGRDRKGFHDAGGGGGVGLPVTTMMVQDVYQKLGNIGRSVGSSELLTR
jgi:hypothetical protein